MDLPPDDSLICRDEDTAKLRRRAGEAAAAALVGRRARAGRRKSLDAILRMCVYGTRLVETALVVISAVVLSQLTEWRERDRES